MAPTPCDSPNRLLFRREIGGMKTDALTPEGRLMDRGRVGRFPRSAASPVNKKINVLLSSGLYKKEV
jgi:hypothetical protein